MKWESDESEAVINGLDVVFEALHLFNGQSKAKDHIGRAIAHITHLNRRMTWLRERNEELAATPTPETSK